MRISAEGHSWKNDGSHKALFQSIDKQWKGFGYSFSFLPKNELKARSIINGLLPYLRAFYGQELWAGLDKCFTPTAIKSANNTRWDEKRGAVSMEDDMVTCLLVNDDDKDMEFDFTEMETSDDLAPSAEDGGTSNSASATTIDSVPTFNPGLNQPKKCTTKKKQAANSAQTETTSVVDQRVKAALRRTVRSAQSSNNSTTSSVTIDTRLSALEARLTAQAINNDLIVQLAKDVAQILKSQGIEQDTGPPPNNKKQLTTRNTIFADQSI